MNIVGIIAEYNPFHTGHAYQLRKAREEGNADFIVIVMSPDFVQRGEPALFDKYTRARMALMNGADLVLELPVWCACGSAEYFAEGAIALLDSLGVITQLCFGCESEDPSLFIPAASILNSEPDAYRLSLQKALRHGRSFPQARAQALTQQLHQLFPEKKTVWDVFLSSPNNILGIEYCRSLLHRRSSIRILPIHRKGSLFSSTALDGSYCSATAMRKGIMQHSSRVLHYVPDNCHTLFQESCRYPVTSTDLMPWIIYCLLRSDHYEQILDISPDLSDRIRKFRFAAAGHSYEELVSLLKTKQITEARIRRALLHLVLNITDDLIQEFTDSRTVPYARLLGFRRTAGPLLHQIKQQSTIPLLARTSDAASLLTSPGQRLLDADFSASHFYRSILASRYGVPFRTEYEQSPVIL